MKIKVTQEHINEGEPGSCDWCPIALALSDAGIQSASVTVPHVEMFGKSSLLPPAALKFARDFDALQPVEPFEFELQEAE